MRFLRRITDSLLASAGHRRGSVIGESLGAQVAGLRDRLEALENLARDVTAEEAQLELSRGNCAAKVASELRALDANKDGAVSLAELQAGLLRGRLRLSDEEASRFLRMIDSSNTDNRISIAEFSVSVCLGTAAMLIVALLFLRRIALETK